MGNRGSLYTMETIIMKLLFLEPILLIKKPPEQKIWSRKCRRILYVSFPVYVSLGATPAPSPSPLPRVCTPVCMFVFVYVPPVYTSVRLFIRVCPSVFVTLHICVLYCPRVCMSFCVFVPAVCIPSCVCLSVCFPSLSIFLSVCFPPCVCLLSLVCISVHV